MTILHLMHKQELINAGEMDALAQKLEKRSHLGRKGKVPISSHLKLFVPQKEVTAWFDECGFFSEQEFTQIGKNKEEWNSDDYNPDVSTLFGSYHHYCRRAGLQGKSLNNFSPELEKLCQKVLGFKFVKRDRIASGIRGFKGIRLRREYENRISDRQREA